jgi:hypothetical protein
MMIIKCPQCGAVPKVSDIQLQSGSAVCRNCDLGFQFERVDRSKLSTPFSNEKDDQLFVRQQREGLVIEFSWRNRKDILVAGCAAVIWNFLIFNILFENKESFLNQIEKDPALLIFSLHPLIGLFILYYLLAKVLNKTRIITDGLTVRVEIGPLWWRGSKRINVGEISQFYVERYESYRQNGKSVYKFKVKYMAQESHEVLVSGLSSFSRAKKIEEVLEEKLGIQDKIVENEFK